MYDAPQASVLYCIVGNCATHAARVDGSTRRPSTFVRHADAFADFEQGLPTISPLVPAQSSGMSLGTTPPWLPWFPILNACSVRLIAPSIGGSIFIAARIDFVWP